MNDISFDDQMKRFKLRDKLFRIAQTAFEEIEVVYGPSESQRYPIARALIEEFLVQVQQMVEEKGYEYLPEPICDHPGCPYYKGDGHNHE